MYLQWRFSEEECAQLEEAASCAKVLKVEVKVDMWGSDRDESARFSRALAAGLARNQILREVQLKAVPEEAKMSVREALCSNTALTVDVR